MILELDAGNTRIKWRVRQLKDGSGWQKVAEGSVFAQQKIPSVFIELGKQLEKLPMERISRMLVASVRGDGFKDAFSSLMMEKWHLHPEFAEVTASCAGVRNGYQDPSRLGADRWLATVAAWARTQGACCVVDCGTTITLDLVDATGQHQGGYIVPGLQLMRDALGTRSRALATPDKGWERDTPGTSTAEAVHHGILAMALGFLRDVHQRNQAPGQSMAWYLTGGDASVLAPYLGWELALVPDLVMDGLSLAMLPVGSAH